MSQPPRRVLSHTSLTPIPALRRPALLSTSAFEDDPNATSGYQIWENLHTSMAFPNFRTLFDIWF
jgi:hypothetical protein